MPGEPAFFHIPPQQQQHGPPPGQRPMPPPPPMHPMHPPPLPPPEALPVELRFNRPRVEVVEVSESFMSPAEMAAKCTEYAAFRFEKCSSNSSSNNDYYSRQALDRDEEATTKSSWGQAVRTAIHDQPQQELAKEVRRLNLQTSRVLEKKKGLGTDLQRQLDRTISDLTASEHDQANFQWTLAQIDHQLRQVGPGNTIFHTREPLVTRSHKHKSDGKKAHKSKCKRRSRSRSRNISKPGKIPSSSKAKCASYPSVINKQYERVSLTAYFKRAPRPGVDVNALLQHRKRMQAMTQVNAFSHQQDPRAAHQGQGVPMRVPLQGPPGQQRPQGPPPQRPNLNGGPVPPPRGNGGGRPVGKVNQKNGKKKAKPYIESGSETSSSASDPGSESDGWSEDESVETDPTSITDMSSQSGRHGKRGRTHNRNHSRSKSQVKGRIPSRPRSRMRRPSLSRHRHCIHDGSSAFGISPCSPRMHQRHGSIYPLNRDPVFVPPSPRPPPPPPAAPIIVQPSQRIEIERIRDEAYINGRKDEKDKNRVLEELSSDHCPPRSLSRTRPGVRHVERPQPRRETRGEPRGRAPRRPVDDLETGDSYSSTEDEAKEYESEYRRTENHHRSGRRGGAGYHRSSRVFPPRTPPLSPTPPPRGAYGNFNFYDTHRQVDDYRRRESYPESRRAFDHPVDSLYGYPQHRTSDYMQDHDEPPRHENPFEPRFESRYRPYHH